MDPTLLIIIVFIIAPLVERLLKAGKQQGPTQLPPQQRPRPPVQAPPRSQHQEQHREARNRVVVRRDEEDATAVLPDDLWEILTGEKRTPAPPRADEAEDEEFEEREEARSLETTSAGEWISVPPEPVPAPSPEPAPTPTARRPSAWSDYQAQRHVPAPADRAPIRVEEGYVRPLPRHEAPRIVSLEELDIDDEVRHDAFHEKLERNRTRARVQTPKAHRFTTDEDLRHAIVMAEVLGKPRGLDGLD